MPRLEYNDYCRWVCEQLDNLYFGYHVKSVKAIAEGFSVVVTCHGVEKSYDCKIWSSVWVQHQRYLAVP
nr:SidA/IucD/PvdA family monooxygenase [Moraxella osloensis]